MTTELLDADAPPAESPDEANGSEIRLNKDGTIRKKPGPKPGGRRPNSRRAAPAPGRRPATAKAQAEPDYRPALAGIAQVPQLVLGMVARFTKKDAFALDSLAIGVHVPALVEAVNETAKTQPAVAAVCERLAAVGPYGLVITAVTPMVAQILCNHGVLPANEQMGVFPPGQLVERAQQMAGA